MEYPVSIINAIHEVMQKVGYVQKKDKNQFHKYNYAGESALLEVLRPAMLEAGLILIPSGKDVSPIDEYGNTHVAMEYTMAHVDGSVWPEKLCAFGTGGDKNSKGGVGDKGTYKAITGAGKYLLFKLFLIETGDDPENDGGKKTSTDKGAKTNPTDSNGNKPFKVVNEAQIKRFHAIKKDFEWSDTGAKSLLAKYEYTSTKEIEAWEDYGKIIKELQKGEDGKAKANAEGYCIFANGKEKAQGDK